MDELRALARAIERREHRVEPAQPLRRGGIDATEPNRDGTTRVREVRRERRRRVAPAVVVELAGCWPRAVLAPAPVELDGASNDAARRLRLGRVPIAAQTGEHGEARLLVGRRALEELTVLVRQIQTAERNGHSRFALDDIDGNGVRQLAADADARHPRLLGETLLGSGQVEREQALTHGQRARCEQPGLVETMKAREAHLEQREAIAANEDPAQADRSARDTGRQEKTQRDATDGLEVLAERKDRQLGARETNTAVALARKGPAQTGTPRLARRRRPLGTVRARRWRGARHPASVVSRADRASKISHETADDSGTNSGR